MSWGVSSSSNPQTTSNTQTTQSVAGASASYSPTVMSSGTVNLSDQGATKEALSGMSDVALAALDEQSALNSSALSLLSDFNARQQQSQVDSTQSSNDLLSSVLENNQTLAQNVQSGGATTGMQLTTKVVIGALAVMGLLVAMVLYRK